MGKLLPLILALVGTGAGVGAGVALRPEPQAEAKADGELAYPCGEPSGGDEGEKGDKAGKADPDAAVDYVKLNNQFVIPVVTDGAVSALVVLAMSLEVIEGSREAVFEREPKLRDAFLQVLFDHANAGGFNGSFTDSAPMKTLRRALREAAHKVMGDTVRDVLIIDIVRQDT